MKIENLLLKIEVEVLFSRKKLKVIHVISDHILKWFCFRVLLNLHKLFQ